MINGLNILYYNLKNIGYGLNLTGTNVKGKGCNITCDKKRILKNKMDED